MLFRQRWVLGAGILGLLIVQGSYAEDTDEEENPEPARAAELADRKLPSRPKDNALWASLVGARLELGDLVRAGEALAIWRRNVPGVRKSFPLVERLQGDLEKALGHNEPAANAWRIYVGLVPKDVEGWDRLADAETSLEHIPEALAAASGALKAKPSASRLVRRAQLWIRLRDWKNAETDLREANKLDATESTLQKTYPVFERSAKWLPAVKTMDKQILADTAGPEKASHLMDRAEVLAAEGFSGLAYEDAAAALVLAPNSTRAQLRKGQLAWEVGKPSEVGLVRRVPVSELPKDWQNRLLEIDKEVDPERRADWLVSAHQPVMALHLVETVEGSVAKAKALAALEEVPKAEQAAKAALKAHPDDPWAWIVVGRLELGSGNVTEALECAGRALTLKELPEAQNLKKEALSRSGKP